MSKALKFGKLSDQREGAEGFLLGFRLCLVAFKANHLWDKQMLELVRDMANNIYPPFDPPPSPTKAYEDGERRDGIRQQE